MSGVILRQPDHFGAAICDALGLKRVKKLVLTMEVDSMPKVEATVFADDEVLTPVLKRFHLEAVPVLESARAEPEADKAR
jgi:hypothetical protein